MKKVGLRYLSLVSIITALLIGSLGFGIAAAAEPERGITLTTTNPDIVRSIGEKIEVPVKVTNTGKVAEDVTLQVASAPEGWEYHFEASYPKGIIRAVYLPPKTEGEYDYKQDVTFSVKSPKDARAGDYRFILKVVTRDGVIESSLGLTIGLSEEAAAVGGVKLSTMYPVLRGACGTNFQFKVDIKNESGEDYSFGLSAEAPRGWDVSFSPSYEQTQITTISLKNDESKSLDVAITPLPWEKPGEYTVAVRASSGAMKDELPLKVVLTGSYELELWTATGRLDTKATAGTEGHLSIFVVNTGSADIHDITLSSPKKIEGWVVTFSPDRIDSLPVGMQQEITVGIEPPGKSIAGDYEVTLMASAERATESMDIRVAVGTPTKWGWVGVGIIVLVVAGLAVLFTRLGRR